MAAVAARNRQAQLGLLQQHPTRSRKRNEEEEEEVVVVVVEGKVTAIIRISVKIRRKPATLSIELWMSACANRLQQTRNWRRRREERKK